MPAAADQHLRRHPRGRPRRRRGGPRAWACPAGRCCCRVELPLAVPLIAAGFRTAAVQVVATATLAALVGGGGLGVIINTGFGQQDRGQIVAGGILVAALALVAELALAFVQRQVTPGRARGRPAGPAGRAEAPRRHGATGQTRPNRTPRSAPSPFRDRAPVAVVTPPCWGRAERAGHTAGPARHAHRREPVRDTEGGHHAHSRSGHARHGRAAPHSQPLRPAATAAPRAPRPHRPSPAARPAAQACEAVAGDQLVVLDGRQAAADRRQHHPGGQRRRRDPAAARRARTRCRPRSTPTS